MSWNVFFETILFFILLLWPTYMIGAMFRPLSDGPNQIKVDIFSGMVNVMLGLIVLVYFIFFIGLIELFNIYGLTGFLLLFFILNIRRSGDYWKWLKSFALILREGSSISSRFLSCLLLFLFLFLTVMTAFPEIANDAVCYQLHIPKIFAGSHSTNPIPYELNSYMPLFMNYLYAIGLLIDNVIFAKFFHLISGFFLVISLIIALKRNQIMFPMALFLGTILLVTPTLWNQITHTYVDAGAALFIFVGLLIFQFYETSGKARMIAGIFLGAAISVKFYLLAMVGLFYAILILIDSFQKGWKHALRIWRPAIAATLVTCAPWFIRNMIHIGNPVYPYLGSLFGMPGLDKISNYAGEGVPKTLWNFLLTPVYLAFYPDVFGRGHWMGPFYLLLLPFSIWAMFRFKRFRIYGLFVLIYYCVWFFMAQVVRFLMPLFPILLYTSATGIRDITEKIKIWRAVRGVWIAGHFIILVFMTGLGIWHFRYEIQSLLVGQSKHEYLTAMERAYPAALWINENLPQNVKILNAEEIHQFYFERTVVRESFLNRKTKYASRYQTPDQLLNFFKSLGFTHILRAIPNKPASVSERIERIDRLINESQDIVLVNEISSNNIRDQRYHYRIYKIS